MVAQSQQLCTFTVDRYTFGVEVQKVQEVLRSQEMTRVPLAPWVVRGLINLRGQIVTAIDLRRRLGLPDAPVGVSPMCVILRSDQGAVSLLVDKIGDVREVSRDVFEPPPVTLSDLGRDLIHGVYKLPDKLLILLDAEQAIASTLARAKTSTTSSRPDSTKAEGKVS
ncbi:MAG TPA: chemotaxis protein CheW [Polyangia bacterium]|jgi:purine-binding chemotaxis protein CheW|nr:chemotaxis protein CheW [Polyangia bacterium]